MDGYLACPLPLLEINTRIRKNEGERRKGDNLTCPPSIAFAENKNTIMIERRGRGEGEVGVGSSREGVGGGRDVEKVRRARRSQSKIKI